MTISRKIIIQRKKLHNDAIVSGEIARRKHKENRNKRLTRRGFSIASVLQTGEGANDLPELSEESRKRANYKSLRSHPSIGKPDHSSPGDRQHSSEMRGGSIGRPIPTSVASFLPPPHTSPPPRRPGGQRPTVNGPSFSLFNLASISLVFPFLSRSLATTNFDGYWHPLSLPLFSLFCFHPRVLFFPPGEQQHVQ